MACLAHYLNFFPQLLQDFDDSLPSQSQLSIPPPKGFEVLPLYLSVKWKLQNIVKLIKTNPQKYKQGVKRLVRFFGKQ